MRISRIAILLAIFFVMLSTQDELWAETSVGFGGVQGVSMPAGKQVIGGIISAERGFVDGGVVYLHHFLNGKAANVFGGEWGVSLQRRGMFVRLFTSPMMVWGADEVSAMPNVTTYRLLPARFEVGAGVEIGGVFDFLDLPGEQRLAVRVEYMPDAFDGRVGGRGGDVFIGARLSFHFSRKS